jgi:hypothetical protein
MKAIAAISSHGSVISQRKNGRNGAPGVVGVAEGPAEVAVGETLPLLKRVAALSGLCVFVGRGVRLGVAVDVLVEVAVSVAVGVSVHVEVGLAVRVAVLEGVLVDVAAGAEVFVAEGAAVLEEVEVEVATAGGPPVAVAVPVDMGRTCRRPSPLGWQFPRVCRGCLGRAARFGGGRLGRSR